LQPPFLLQKRILPFPSLVSLPLTLAVQLAVFFSMNEDLTDLNSNSIIWIFHPHGGTDLA
jgi:hypothetical protein